MAIQSACAVNWDGNWFVKVSRSIDDFQLHRVPSEREAMAAASIRRLTKLAEGLAVDWDDLDEMKQCALTWDEFIPEYPFVNCLKAAMVKLTGHLLRSGW